MGKSKAALVVGLNYKGGTTVRELGELNAAIDCAEDVAHWLEPEFDVKILTDASGGVTVSDLTTALRDFFAKDGGRTYLKYQMLLIYFAGHGIEVNNTDHWVLNGAHDWPGESVDVNELNDMANRCGIPNVVIISDACRQDTNLSRSLKALRGSPILPIKDPNADRSEAVDVMRAAKVGRTAWEKKPPGARGFSIFSRALIRLATRPPPDRISTVHVNGTPVDCVTNRTLARYMQEEVNNVLVQLKETKSQKISMIVPSWDDVFVRALPTDTAQPEDATRGGPGSDLPDELLPPQEPSDGFLDEDFSGDPLEEPADSADAEDDIWSVGDEPRKATGGAVEHTRRGPPIPEDFSLDEFLDPAPEPGPQPAHAPEPGPRPDLTSIAGIDAAAAEALGAAGVTALADLADIRPDQMAAAEAALPGITETAQRDAWQHKARLRLEEAGLRLPVARIAKASLGLEDGTDLPESNSLFAGDIRREMERIEPISERESFETGCGQIWRGAEVVRAYVLPQGAGGAEVVEEDIGTIGNPVRAYLDSSLPEAACLTIFADGRSTLQPLIQGFIGYGAIDSVGVSSYGFSPLGVPVGAVARGDASDPVLEDLLELRALLVMTLRDGWMASSAREAVDDLLARIEALWEVDPSLTVLAAALLARTGRMRDIAQRLGHAPHASAFYDVELLQRYDHGGALPGGTLMPCPMLSENWSYIGSRMALAEPPFDAPHGHLLGSLWTSFDLEMTHRIETHLNN